MQWGACRGSSATHQLRASHTPVLGSSSWWWAILWKTYCDDALEENCDWLRFQDKQPWRNVLWCHKLICSGNSCHNYTGQPVTDSGNGGSDDAVQMVEINWLLIIILSSPYITAAGIQGLITSCHTRHFHEACIGFQYLTPCAGWDSAEITLYTCIMYFSDSVNCISLIL